MFILLASKRDEEIGPTVSTHFIVFTLHLCNNGACPNLFEPDKRHFVEQPRVSSTVVTGELVVVTEDSRE